MVVSTKYAIGDEVYAIYKIDDEAHIFKDKIAQIVIISEKEHLYYLEENDCEEYREDELVKTSLAIDWIDKIKELTGGQN